MEHNFIQMFVSVSTLFATTPLVFPRIDVWETTAENSILMTCHYPVLESTSDWLKHIYLGARGKKPYPDLGNDTSSVWNFVGISFREETSCGFY